MAVHAPFSTWKLYGKFFERRLIILLCVLFFAVVITLILSSCSTKEKEMPIWICTECKTEYTGRCRQEKCSKCGASRETHVKK